MPDENPVNVAARCSTLQQVDKARGDLYAIADDLDFLKAQLARIPTRKELARMALMAVLGAAGLVIGVDRSVLAAVPVS
jgi:hypothetical protein